MEWGLFTQEYSHIYICFSQEYNSILEQYIILKHKIFEDFKNLQYPMTKHNGSFTRCDARKTNNKKFLAV